MFNFSIHHDLNAQESKSEPSPLYHILVAEDNPRTRKALLAMMASLAPGKVQVTGANDGRQAVAMANENRPDLVLMDVHMPELDGLEAARRIREHHPGTKIILLSMAGHYREAALEAGADAFLAKSGAPELLLQTVQELVQKEGDDDAYPKE